MTASRTLCKSASWVSVTGAILATARLMQRVQMDMGSPSHARRRLSVDLSLLCEIVQAVKVVHSLVDDSQEVDTPFVDSPGIQVPKALGDRSSLLDLDWLCPAAAQSFLPRTEALLGHFPWRVSCRRGRNPDSGGDANVVNRPDQNRRGVWCGG